MVILVGPWFSLDEMIIFPLPGGFGSKVDLVRLVTWSAAVDIKAASVFVTFSSYISYSHLFYQNTTANIIMIALASLSKNSAGSTHVPGILPKARSTPLIFCPLFSIKAATKLKDVFFVSAAIPKIFDQTDHGEKPALEPINSKLAAIYSLSSTSISRLFIIKDSGGGSHVRSCVSPS